MDVDQIKELANVQLSSSESTPSQALAATVAKLINQDPSGPDGNFTTVSSAETVLKYLYPTYTDQQLKGATITPTQAVAWLHSMGYTATIVDRPLTTSEITSYLSKSEPIITILSNQNTDDWLAQTYAGILYAHDSVTAGTEALHESFIKSINYGDAEIQDGSESQPFTFSDMENSPDPLEQKSTYKWVSTITDIKPDPSWSNTQTIKSDKSTGVFTSKLTTSGTQSELDFTDSAVTGLVSKYPQTNTDQVSKLAAVSLINLYEDSTNQKTVADLDNYLGISASTYVTSAQIESWYKYLGFDFDVIKGKAPMASTQAINKSGRLYLTTFKAKATTTAEQTMAAIGTGYLNNTFNGYQPFWTSVKSGENLTPYYNTPLTTAGQTQYQKLASTFSYSDIYHVVTASGKVSKLSYSEDETIYNIRGKGVADPTEVSQTPSASVTTPPQTSTVQPTTNGNYVTAPNFKIRETQGQEPWCEEYVEAAAINDVEGVTTDDSDITAKSIVQGLNPDLTEDELEETTGGTMQGNLKYYQDKYGVTADIVNRPLTFSEVKQQIDNGQIVEVNAYDINNPATAGTADNLGHAVAIVGYVTPKSGSQTPYYEVWNPWWNQLFYLSTTSTTFDLGGVEYKWTDSWYNWRKSSAVSDVSATIAERKTAAFSSQSVRYSNQRGLLNREDWSKSSNNNVELMRNEFRMNNSLSDISSQNNVASSTSLYEEKNFGVAKDTNNLFNQNFQVSKVTQPAQTIRDNQMGAETTFYNCITKEDIGYRVSKNGGYFVDARINKTIKSNLKAGTLTNEFQNDVDGLRSDWTYLMLDVGAALVLAMATVASGGADMLILETFFGGFGVNGDLITIAAKVMDLKSLTKDVDKVWGEM